ncbi:cortactin-binding protein 2-like isoform X5 [Schistocerca gregaria]|uniref:cortactin-binding protein 2-like isoform X5 n=1 Tax=Schistocerca gregaria TaxID=7010 RepID=UPI00211F23BC|nr:cortactin-binding protein 2-like isoform X5 [Schistocerca gregaria]
MTAVSEGQEPAAADLGGLLDAGDGAVVTLEAGHTRLAAHAAVLAARSPVFAAMFQHHMLEAASGRVRIADVEGPVMRQLLAYMYTLQTPRLASTAPQLLAAADKYGLTALKAACERHMAAQLDVENAAAAAVVAVRHSCPELAAEAVAFINANRQVLSTRGWAEAMRNHLEHVIEVTRLLSESPAETRSAGSGGTAAALWHGRWGRTPVASVAPIPPLSRSPPDDADASRMRPPAAGHKKKTAPTQRQSKHSRTPAAAAAPVAAPPSASSDAADACRSPSPDTGDSKTAASVQAHTKCDRTRVAAVASTEPQPTPPYDDAVSSRMRSPDTGGSKTAASVQAHTKRDRTRVAAVSPTEPQPTPPYDDAVSSRMGPPAAGDKKKTAATHLQSKHSRAPAVAAALVAAPSSSPSDASADCCLPRPASGDSRSATKASAAPAATTTTTSTTSVPHGDRDDPCPACAEAAPLTTPRSTPPVDAATVSRLRKLSGEEKGRRLIEAAKVGAVTDVQTLLAAGADLEVRDSDGYTALHWAAERGHVDVATCLLEGGAEVDATNDSRITPLHRAAQSGHAAVVRLLAASSARTDARNRWGWTPLHWAAMRGHAEAAAALLEAGADREATTDELYTPLDFARHKHYQQLISMLR